MGEWRLVYNGSGEKCYNVKFVRKEGNGLVQIVVYVDNQEKERLRGVDESTDVCGKKIDIYGGYISPWDQTTKGYWRATEIR